MSVLELALDEGNRPWVEKIQITAQLKTCFELGFHLRRAPERSRRNRRPHVSAAKAPTANDLARLVSHTSDCGSKTLGVMVAL